MQQQQQKLFGFRSRGASADELFLPPLSFFPSRGCSCLEKPNHSRHESTRPNKRNLTQNNVQPNPMLTLKTVQRYRSIPPTWTSSCSASLSRTAAASRASRLAASLAVLTSSSSARARFSSLCCTSVRYDSACVTYQGAAVRQRYISRHISPSAHGRGRTCLLNQHRFRTLPGSNKARKAQCRLAGRRAGRQVPRQTGSPPLHAMPGPLALEGSSGTTHLASLYPRLIQSRFKHGQPGSHRIPLVHSLFQLVHLWPAARQRGRLAECRLGRQAGRRRGGQAIG
jgi:hypothetical protein